MTRPNMHTATDSGGVTHTMSQNGWQRLTGRSRTFLTDKMKEAARNGVVPEMRMQYAIEQEPVAHCNGGRRVDGDGKQGTHQEKVRKNNISMINRFLYGGGR